MRRFLAIALLIFSVTLAFPGFGKPPAAEKWDANVLDLMRLDRRDAAYAALVKQGKYPPRAGYREEKVHAVKDVVLCPQSNGLPLFAVFLRDEDDPPAASKKRNGHYIYVAADGTIIPVYSGANSMD